MGFYAGLVDENTGVGIEPGKGKADVVVDKTDFGGCDSGVLEFHGRAFLTSENDDVGTLDSDGTGSCVEKVGYKY